MRQDDRRFKPSPSNVNDLVRPSIKIKYKFDTGWHTLLIPALRKSEGGLLSPGQWGYITFKQDLSYTQQDPVFKLVDLKN